MSFLMQDIPQLAIAIAFQAQSESTTSPAVFAWLSLSASAIMILKWLYEVAPSVSRTLTTYMSGNVPDHADEDLSFDYPEGCDIYSECV